MGYLRILLYSDSASLVLLLSSKCISPLLVMWLVRDPQSLLSDSFWFSLLKVPHSMIQPAHVLASSVRRHQLLRHRFKVFLFLFFVFFVVSPFVRKKQQLINK